MISAHMGRAFYNKAILSVICLVAAMTIAYSTDGGSNYGIWTLEVRRLITAYLFSPDLGWLHSSSTKRLRHSRTSSSTILATAIVENATVTCQSMRL